MTESTSSRLWPGMHFLERGWLSANNIFFTEGDGGTVVDTGYVSHAAQTQALVADCLQGLPLQRIVNTHLHSDHCGGNAQLQTHWPAATTWVPPGQWDAVAHWDANALSYTATGQNCPRFRADGVLQPGSTLELGGRTWHIHAAPGHDTHAIMLYEPERRLLISGDALWQNGFGVVFPEIEGDDAFVQVADTLDVIASLSPLWVLPGHGAMFGDVPSAIATARRRLAGFVQNPQRHAQYAAKVLLKYKLLEWQRRPLAQVRDWCLQTPYLHLLHQKFFATQGLLDWLDSLVEGLHASGAAAIEHDNGTPVLSNR